MVAEPEILALIARQDGLITTAQAVHTRSSLSTSLWSRRASTPQPLPTRPQRLDWYRDVRLEPDFSAADGTADITEDKEDDADDEHDRADRVEETHTGQVADEQKE